MEIKTIAKKINNYWFGSYINNDNFEELLPINLNLSSDFEDKSINNYIKK